MPERNPEIVVITGASAGVGRATVRQFARRGAWIGLIARGHDRLEATRREVEGLGGRALVLPCDVADAKAVESAADRVEQEFGPIAVWVNNAMTSVFSPFLEMTTDEFERVVRVTLMGYVHGTRAALRHMVLRGSGHIVQVSSALAFRSIPLQSAYCASKHAIAGFTESLRTELLHDRVGVKLSMVHLPAVNTPQFAWTRTRLAKKAQPVPPIFDPDVPARAIYWAAHHGRRDITVGWSSLRAILADKFAPRLLDHVAARSGWDGQLTDQPEDGNRPNNLFTPVPGDWAARGTFSGRAKKRSPQTWLNLHRNWIFGGLALLAGGGLAARRLA